MCCLFIKALTKCLHQCEWRGVLMSMDQNKEEYIWEGSGNPGNQNAVRQWASWGAWPQVSLQTGFHVLCSLGSVCRRRPSSSPACVEIQRFQESMDSTQPGWVPGHMTDLLQVPGPQKAVFGLCQMSQHWSRWTESCIYLPLTDPTTVQPVWPQQELYWNQTCDCFCPPHPIYCTKAKC